MYDREYTDFTAMGESSKAMKSRILVALLLLGAGSNLDLVAQWREVKGNLPSFSMSWAIDACDSLTAAIAIVVAQSDHRIYVTTDGGVSWANRSVPTQGEWLTDVSIIDSSHLWATTYEGHIYGSTDGGRNWTAQFYDTTVTDFMHYIEMFNLTDGVALGHARPGQPIAFLRTADGGTTWTRVNDSQLVGAFSGDIWRRVDFVNINVGYFYDTDDAKLVKTTDGGTTWHTTGFMRGYIQVLKFYDEHLGIAARVPQVFRTTNGGDTWETFDVGGFSYGFDFEFFPGDPSKVWYASGKLFFSSDTGRTWRVQNLGGVQDIDIPDSGCGWLLTVGSVYRTANPAELVTGVEPPADLPLAYGLSQNYPNPFNPSTTIKYELLKASDVRLSVFDMLGREVSVLVNERRDAGVHEVKYDAMGLASGVYLYRLRAGGCANEDADCQMTVAHP